MNWLDLICIKHMLYLVKELRHIRSDKGYFGNVSTWSQEHSQKKALLTYPNLEEAAMEQAEHKSSYNDKIIPFSNKWLTHLKVAIS